MIKYLQALRQLLGYLLCLTILISPFGWYLLYLMFRIGKDPIAMYVWLNLDRIGCAVCHKLPNRTISGLTGERAYKGIKRYKVQEKIINWIMLKLANDPNHCYDAYLWEKAKGYVDNTDIE